MISRSQKSKLLRIATNNPRRTLIQIVGFFVVVTLVFSISYFAIPSLLAARFDKKIQKVVATSTPAISAVVVKKDEKSVWVATHLPTPAPLKAIYMTSCVAGSKELRSNLVKLIQSTELNSVIIDIKDYSGMLSFIPDDPNLKDLLSTRCYVRDMKDFIASLHEKNIYVIGRITVFQDPFFAKLRPDLAVKKKSDGTTWKDYKGISFTDPGSKEVWDHTIAIAKESYRFGFDELNFDYIRFPSDGNMKDIDFTWSKGRPKAEVLKGFFAYLNKNLKSTVVASGQNRKQVANASNWVPNAEGVGEEPVISADLFGMTTTNIDDLNIGQVLENALPYFDYIAPMVYPSHYPPNFMGFANPADKPYEIIKFSMDAAVRRTIATTTLVDTGGVKLASSSPALYKKEGYSALKIRPWLQDFNLGATYTAEMVRKQIQATYDSGLDSWMLWNASNRYTAGALKTEQ